MTTSKKINFLKDSVDITINTYGNKQKENALEAIAISVISGTSANVIKQMGIDISDFDYDSIEYFQGEFNNLKKEFIAIIGDRVNSINKQSKTFI